MKKYNYKTISENECKELVSKAFNLDKKNIYIIGVDSICITFQNTLTKTVYYVFS